MKQNFELRPLKGVKRKEKIEFDQKKSVFDILSFNDFVFFANSRKRQNVENASFLIEFDFFLAFDTL